MTMKIEQTPLPGLFEMTTVARRDDRGEFTRLFCLEAFNMVRSDLRFVQVNHSVTRLAGTVRGLHFQREPHAEAKLIRCLRGAVFDVAVDLRLQSPTFGRWHSIELSASNHRQIFIPEGFAHGFQSLTDDAELLYHHTVSHAAAHESGILFSDERVGIAWPLPITAMSVRDAQLPALLQLFPEIVA